MLLFIQYFPEFSAMGIIGTVFPNSSYKNFIPDLYGILCLGQVLVPSGNMIIGLPLLIASCTPYFICLIAFIPLFLSIIIIDILFKYHPYIGIFVSSFLMIKTGSLNKYKNNIENEFTELELLIGKINIYFIRENEYRILLKDIWEYYYFSVSLVELKTINYFKNFFEIITKMLVYNNIINYLIVYKNNKETFTVKFNNYIKWLSEYKEVISIFNQFNNAVKKDLGNRLSL